MKLLGYIMITLFRAIVLFFVLVVLLLGLIALASKAIAHEQPHRSGEESRDQRYRVYQGPYLQEDRGDNIHYDFVPYDDSWVDQLNPPEQQRPSQDILEKAWEILRERSTNDKPN